MRAKNSKRKVAQPVRVLPASYERLQRLAAKAVQSGWQSLGASRADMPTMAAVIDEALLRLEISPLPAPELTASPRCR